MYIFRGMDSGNARTTKFYTMSSISFTLALTFGSDPKGGDENSKEFEIGMYALYILRTMSVSPCQYHRTESQSNRSASLGLWTRLQDTEYDTLFYFILFLTASVAYVRSTLRHKDKKCQRVNGGYPNIARGSIMSITISSWSPSRTICDLPYMHACFLLHSRSRYFD